MREARQRAIKDLRRKFGKEIFILAEGGIIDDSGWEAWEALDAGANMVAGYTGFMFGSFGLLLHMAKGLESKLKQNNFKNLEEFQRSKGLIK